MKQIELIIKYKHGFNTYLQLVCAQCKKGSFESNEITLGAHVLNKADSACFHFSLLKYRCINISKKMS